MLNVEDEPKMTLEKVLETGKLRKMAVPVIEGKKKIKAREWFENQCFHCWMVDISSHQSLIQQ